LSGDSSPELPRRFNPVRTAKSKTKTFLDDLDDNLDDHDELRDLSSDSGDDKEYQPNKHDDYEEDEENIKIREVAKELEKLADRSCNNSLNLFLEDSIEEELNVEASENEVHPSTIHAVKGPIVAVEVPPSTSHDVEGPPSTTLVVEGPKVAVEGPPSTTPVVEGPRVAVEGPPSTTTTREAGEEENPPPGWWHREGHEVYDPHPTIAFLGRGTWELPGVKEPIYVNPKKNTCSLCKTRTKGSWCGHLVSAGLREGKIYKGTVYKLPLKKLLKAQQPKGRSGTKAPRKNDYKPAPAEVQEPHKSHVEDGGVEASEEELSEEAPEVELPLEAPEEDLPDPEIRAPDIIVTPSTPKVL
jgi:hypothetical protein